MSSNLESNAPCTSSEHLGIPVDISIRSNESSRRRPWTTSFLKINLEFSEGPYAQDHSSYKIWECCIQLLKMDLGSMSQLRSKEQPNVYQVERENVYRALSK